MKHTPRPLIFSLFGPALLSVLVHTSCQVEPSHFTPGPVYLDPGLVYRDSALHVDVAGNGRGLIKLGQGWYQQRHRSPFVRWILDSWAGPSPSLYFLAPLHGSWDLVTRCAPFPHPDGLPQSITPVLNGFELPTQKLLGGFQNLRIRLFQEHLRPGINELVLRFAWAVVPLEIEEGNEHRPTAAKVSSVQIVPRDLSPRIARKTASVIAEEDGVITLRPGSPVAMPVLLNGGRTFELTSVEGTLPNELLDLEYQDARGRRRLLWRGHPLQLARRSIDLADLSPDPGYLVVSSHNRKKGALRLRPRLSTHPAGETAIQRGTSGLPNIFIYTIDTLRADTLGVYGYHRSTSPRIDSFAAQATKFERAWSPSPWTPPATMSLLTGLYPYRHGFVHAGQRPRVRLAPLLPQLLRARNYETMAISQSFVIGPTYTFERGFETFYSNDAVARAGSESADVAWFLFNHLAFHSAPERPLFAYIHVVDTHQPYKPQGTDRRFALQHKGTLRHWQYQPNYFMDNNLSGNAREVQHMRGLYDGEVLRADRQFGRFLDVLEFLGLYDSSLVILTADHGEEFADHGGFGHTRTLFEELIHVPLIVKYPHGRWAGRVVPERVSLVDVVPTVLEIVGPRTDDPDLDGQSLANPGRIENDRFLLAEINPWVDEPESGNWFYRRIDLRAGILGELKCIENRLQRDRFGQPAERLEAYHLERDPNEIAALPAGDPQGDACLDRLMGSFREGAPAGPAAESLSGEQQAALKALGYLR